LGDVNCSEKHKVSRWNLGYRFTGSLPYQWIGKKVEVILKVRQFSFLTLLYQGKETFLKSYFFRIEAVQNAKSIKLYFNRYQMMRSEEIARVLPGMKRQYSLTTPGWSSIHSVVNEEMTSGK
jgi:ATP phosphoribosyltransferase